MHSWLKQIIISAALLIGIVPLMVAPIAAAENKCGETDTSIIQCGSTIDDSGKVENSGVWGLLLYVLNILTTGVAVAAVGGIVYASVIYTSASGDVEKSKKARHMLMDIVIGIAAYALMYAALNYLIPGGLFK